MSVPVKSQVVSVPVGVMLCECLLESGCECAC